ncbi:MAG: helix-turn-helix transcriptional regulator [Clostridia bacterium]|nr:helix-turn-helix transcriptional regulator [Clostridia bacterium]
MEDKVLNALMEPKRFLLLQLMSERGWCVRALARKSYLSESAVSQHLKTLREAGLVYGMKRGYYTHYYLDKEAFARVTEEFIALRDAERKPCSGPYYGCSEAEFLRCKAYVPPEKRNNNKE